MANEKNNINELVSDDDDPTAELEAVTFRVDAPERVYQRESDDNTFDIDGHTGDDAATIGKLRYDIEQLRSRWLGLESELEAREEVTRDLNAEIDDLRGSLAGKDNLIKARDRKLKSLKSEIREREELYRNNVAELETELAAARKAIREIPSPPQEPLVQDNVPVAASRFARIEEYADLLRRKLQDSLAYQDDLDKDRRRLETAFADSEESNRTLKKELSSLKADNERLDQKLATVNDQHEEEIRILRFELGSAQETLTETEDLNTQLASDLVDTRGFTQELEHMLSVNDEQSQSRIDELEKELASMARKTQELDEKLESRSDAINVLLRELARRSDQVESISEIGEVISDLDGRIAERFDESETGPAKPARTQERITRVLVGKLGDKLLQFPLFKDRVTIGRTDDNDIQLNAVFISRRHAVITIDGDTTRVIDWGSKNGVYVNSARVTEHFLKNGDIVSIGSVHFRYDERHKRDN